MTAEATEAKPRWRGFRPRMSLRGVIVLVLAIDGGLGWFLHRARVQRQAVAAIRRAGGDIYYEAERTDIAASPPTRPARPWPKWLTDAVGIDALVAVDTVQLIGSQGDKATDDLMTEVGRLGGLKHLRIRGCGAVTDAGLIHLRGLTNLRELDLGFTGIKGPGLANLADLIQMRDLMLDHLPASDADLAFLSALTNLEKLSLDGPNISDAGLAHLRGLDLRQLAVFRSTITTGGLAHLRGMTHLEVLTLNQSRVDSLEPLRHLTALTRVGLANSPITDDGLAAVAGMTRLDSLLLSDTPITDAGLAHIRGLAGLTYLNLGGTKITDAGLASLADLKGLGLLLLHETGITDAGLAHLTGLTGCRKVNVNGTALTAGGAASLMKVVPRMRVSR